MIVTTHFPVRVKNYILQSADLDQLFLEMAEIDRFSRANFLFIKSVLKQYEQNGKITEKQYRALLKIREVSMQRNLHKVKNLI